MGEDPRLAFMPQYLLMFAAGILAYRRGSAARPLGRVAQDLEPHLGS